MVKIAVVGAGINGLACAVRIKEKYKHLEVVLISKDFSPNTTGDGAGGLWYPYLCGATPDHLIRKWGGETYKYLHTLWLEGGSSVCLMPIYYLYREARKLQSQDWVKIVFGYQLLNSKELEYLSRSYSTQFSSGHTFLTFVYPPSVMLAKLYQRFESAGGIVIKAEVTSLEDHTLDPFDVVINCSGIAAKGVVPDDGVFPIRGQVAKVIAPWLNATVIDEDSGHYIIPNTEMCVLGGTHQEHNYNTDLDEQDTNFIVDGCKKLLPGLKHAKLLKHWAGLRPGRNEVRLEPETRSSKLFVHNYGHGGSGLTLFWGCAASVLEIVEKHLSNRQSKI